MGLVNCCDIPCGQISEVRNVSVSKEKTGNSQEYIR